MGKIKSSLLNYKLGQNVYMSEFQLDTSIYLALGKYLEVNHHYPKLNDMLKQRRSKVTGSGYAKYPGNINGTTNEKSLLNMKLSMEVGDRPGKDTEEEHLVKNLKHPYPDGIEKVKSIIHLPAFVESPKTGIMVLPPGR